MEQQGQVCVTLFISPEPHPRSKVSSRFTLALCLYPRKEAAHIALYNPMTYLVRKRKSPPPGTRPPRASAHTVHIGRHTYVCLPNSLRASGIHLSPSCLLAATPSIILPMAVNIHIGSPRGMERARVAVHSLGFG